MVKIKMTELMTMAKNGKSGELPISWEVLRINGITGQFWPILDSRTSEALKDKKYSSDLTENCLI